MLWVSCEDRAVGAPPEALGHRQGLPTAVFLAVRRVALVRHALGTSVGRGRGPGQPRGVDVAAAFGTEQRQGAAAVVNVLQLWARIGTLVSTQLSFFFCLSLVRTCHKGKR